MKRKLVVLSYIIWMLFNASFAYGQGHSFTLGPVASYDHYTTKLQNGYSSTIEPVNSASFGIDFSYSKKRLLLDVKMVTAKRTYILTTYTPDAVNGSYLVDRINANAQYYILPVTASYQIVNANHFQVFAGVGIITEYVPTAFEQKQLDIVGGGPPIISVAKNAESNFNLGGHIQSTIRYHLNESLLIQVEPIFRYFPDVQTPFGFGTRKEISALVTLAYKFH